MQCISNQTKNAIGLITSLVLVLVNTGLFAQKTGTIIEKWKGGKNAAISLTYDDGSINQFTQALPIMNRLSIPATFFIITGQIPGSQYQGKFIGRPVEQIIAETATIPTNKDNFFERASAMGFLGLSGTLEYHTRAGGIYDEDGEESAHEAYAVIDEGYKKVREGAFQPKKPGDNRSGVTWDQIRTYVKQGHEFASHTVSHPRLAVLDDTNMLYELEKSKEEILKQLGAEHTFSAEGPYGTENDRAMEKMYPIYPALRNRMPEPYLEELNRWAKMNPGESKKEYVQWQRGATTKTPLPLMKAWVDTVATHDNNWLVLVFHGVDGIGYEALPHEMLDEYFQYMKSRESALWIATFGDVTKYMRERMAATIEAQTASNKITIILKHTLNSALYNYPLTLRTYVPSSWKSVKMTQGGLVKKYQIKKDGRESYIQYDASPNSGTIELQNQ